MSYNKTTWANGDVITAQKLNNLQSGVENARSTDPDVLTIVIDDNTVVSPSWNEIHDLCFLVFEGQEWCRDNISKQIRVKKLSGEEGEPDVYLGTYWTIIDADYSSDGSHTGRGLYFGCLTGGNYPTVDREGVEPKYVAHTLNLSYMTTPQGSYTYAGYSSVSPADLLNY